MKKLHLILILAFLFTTSTLRAQESGESAFGIGLGLEYGGIGGRYIGYASDNIGIFGGAGYAVAGAGYNFGIQFLLNSEKRAKGFFEIMYGYNGAIKVTGLSGGDFNKVYYGPSFGGGFNLKTRNDTGNFWHFSLLIPIRSSDFNDTWDAIKNDPSIETSIILPFTISVGYNFKL